MSEVEAESSASTEAGLEKSAPLNRSKEGPFDLAELSAMRPYLDMGSIRVEPREGLQVRLDVDQQAKRVVAVSLDYNQSSIQVQAFAAPKTTGLWNSVRSDLITQLKAQSSDFAEIEGTFNKELIAEVKTKGKEGPVISKVRFIGVDGPRWMLRGAITGKALVDEKTAKSIEDIFRSIVVVRGDQPMPPNELLPLKVPAGAQSKGE